MDKKAIIDSFATVVDGEVVSFNFAEFDALVSDLVSERAILRKTNKEAIKASKEAANAELAEQGKAYYNGLEEGATFQYKMADGTIVTARKIKTKSGANNSAACEVIEGIETGKSNKRYPKFHTLLVA